MRWGDLFTITEYYTAGGAQIKFSLLDNQGLCGEKVTVSASRKEICIEDLDPIFRQRVITSDAFTKGYQPAFLDDSNIRERAAAFGNKTILIQDLDIPVLSEGELLIPIELAPLAPLFKDAAGHFEALAGPVTPDVNIVLNLERILATVPGYLPHSLPHCDFKDDKNPAYENYPRIFLSTVDLVGPAYYPDACWFNVARFSRKGVKSNSLENEMVRAGKKIIAPIERWILGTDVHVHSSSPIEMSHVPEQDRIIWKEYGNETGKLVNEGVKCIRNLMHLAFARKRDQSKYHPSLV